MNKKKMGEFIRSLREKKNITQDQLAQHIGVSEKDIQYWEIGRKIPNMYDLELLSFQFDVSVNDLLCGKKNKNQDDDEVFYYATVQRNKHKKNILFGSIIFVVLICIFLLLVLLSKNQDKVDIYKISGESENFYYGNAMFISSKIKNIYVYGDIESKNHKINVKDITNITLKSGDRLIIGSNTLPKQISIENYGYDELFPQEVVDNLDNWYLEITYKVNDEPRTEKINLNNQYVMDKIKVKPIA